MTDYRSEAIKLQHAGKGDNTFELVHIGSAYYRENTRLRGAHSFQRHVQRLIGVHMGKVLFVHSSWSFWKPLLLQQVGLLSYCRSSRGEGNWKQCPRTLDSQAPEFQRLFGPKFWQVVP